MGNWKCVTIEQMDEGIIRHVETETGISVSYIERGSVLVGQECYNDVQILVCRDRDLSKVFLDRFSALEFIFIISAGVEKLPFSYLQERQITVANCGGVSDDAMSDYVIGAMLLFSSRLKDCILYQRVRHWQKYLVTDSLCKKRLLIVGVGKIGTAIAEKASAFHMEIVGIKSMPLNADNFLYITTLENLDEELENADYVVCTLPLTEKTHHLFQADRFIHMKPSAIFINVSRGKIVDEQAIYEALRDKLIGGAVLDVFETEPLSDNSPLWEMDNVVITPHSSGRIQGFLGHAMSKFIENVRAYITDEEIPNRIDLSKRY